MKFLPLLFILSIFSTEIPDYVRELYVLQYKWQLVLENDQVLAQDSITKDYRITVYQAPIDKALGKLAVVNYDSLRYSSFQKRFFIIEDQVRFVETSKVDTSILVNLSPRMFLWKIESYFISEKQRCSMDRYSLFIENRIPTKRDSTIMMSGYNERSYEEDLPKYLCQDVVERNEWVLSFTE